jgi:hypothetical protein
MLGTMSCALETCTREFTAILLLESRFLHSAWHCWKAHVHAGIDHDYASSLYSSAYILIAAVDAAQSCPTTQIHRVSLHAHMTSVLISLHRYTNTEREKLLSEKQHEFQMRMYVQSLRVRREMYVFRSQGWDFLPAETESLPPVYQDLASSALHSLP